MGGARRCTFASNAANGSATTVTLATASDFKIDAAAVPYREGGYRVATRSAGQVQFAGG